MPFETENIDYNYLMNMKLHETCEITNYFITKVVRGWIYTDRRNSEAPSGVFVPFPD